MSKRSVRRVVPARRCWSCRPHGHGPSRVWRRVRSERADPAAGQGRASSNGSTRTPGFTSRSSRTASRKIWMVEGGTPNTLLRRGITQDIAAVGHRDHRRRLPDQGPLAEARQRPRRDVRRRPQAVHGLVGHRRAERRQRPDRRRHQAGAEEARQQLIEHIAAAALVRPLQKSRSSGRRRDREPQRNRQRADQHLAARCVTYGADARDATCGS